MLCIALDPVSHECLAFWARGKRSHALNITRAHWFIASDTCRSAIHVHPMRAAVIAFPQHEFKSSRLVEIELRDPGELLAAGKTHGVLRPNGCLAWLHAASQPRDDGVHCPIECVVRRHWTQFWRGLTTALKRAVYRVAFKCVVRFHKRYREISSAPWNTPRTSMLPSGLST